MAITNIFSSCNVSTEHIRDGVTEPCGWSVAKEKHSSQGVFGLYFIVGKIIKVKIPNTMYYSKDLLYCWIFWGEMGLIGVFQRPVFCMFYNTNWLSIKYYDTNLITNICKQNKKYQLLQKNFILSQVKTKALSVAHTLPIA